MCHLRYRLRIFLFRRKVIFHSQDIQAFVFLTIPWFTNDDVMMSIGTWDSVHFWIYLLNHNLLSHQTWPVDRYKQGQQFSGIFWKIWRNVAKFRAIFNLATCSYYSLTNYVMIPVFHLFQKVNMGQFKMLNSNY